MKRILISLFILLIYTSLLVSQRVAKPASAPSSSSQTEQKTESEEAEEVVIFNEEFNNNDNYWPTGDDDAINLKIENGKMSFQKKKDEGSYYIWNWTYMDGNYPYLIESTIRQTGGPDDYGFGLIWGAEDSGNCYTFNITDNGYYRIAKMDNDEWSEYIDWTETYAINTYGGTNTLKLQREGSLVKFYINGYYVDQISAPNFFNDGVGYVIWMDQTIEIDNLYVKGVEDYEKLLEYLDDILEYWEE